MKKILFMVYHAPVGTIWVNEAVRTAFGMYGEDIEPSVLLIGDATIAIKKGLDPTKVGLLPLNIVLPYIERFETAIYVVKENMERLKIGEIEEKWNVKLLSESKLSTFVHGFDSTIIM